MGEDMDMTPTEPRVTWTPDPRKAWPTQKMLDRLAAETPEDKTYAGTQHGPGYRFEPDGLGGGLLLKFSKTTYGWRLVSQVLPHGA